MTTNTTSPIARSAILAIGAGVTAGWLLTACGDDGGNTDQTTTETTSETTTETTTPEQTTENDGTIEIPSPSISVPDLPDVTVNPAP